MEVLQTLAFGFVGDVYIVVHKAPRVDPAEWKVFSEHLLSRATVNLMLVVAGDAKLDADQRFAVRDAYAKYNMRIGVLADSKVARGIMTAFSWFNVDVKGFPTKDFSGLLVYLGRETLREQLSEAIAPYLQPGWRSDTGS